MTSQRPLFDLPESASARYNVFLGIFPDRPAAERSVERAVRIREKLGLRGRIRPVDHLHVTLHFLGRRAAVPPELMAAMERIGASAATEVPAFDVELDRVIGFQNRRREGPVVLSCADEANASLRELQRTLGEGLAREGIRMARARFVPHLTLLYDRRRIREEMVEPVRWRVEDVVLVRSEVGATKYVELGRWGLRG